MTGSTVFMTGSTVVRSEIPYDAHASIFPYLMQHIYIGHPQTDLNPTGINRYPHLSLHHAHLLSTQHSPNAPQ